jgi:hypothetical protein
MSATGRRDREQAIAAADSTCPRCGTPREADQQYCLECGLALPAVSGRVPSLRRRWIRRLGWYPGDWVWVSLLTLLVAVAGATAAIVLTKQASASGHTFEVPPPVVSTVATPTTPAPTTTVVQPTTTKTPPTKPPRKPVPANGHLTWPASTNGWTIVLVSYPKTIGQAAATQTAERAAKSGLTKVGVLDSSRYASLQPGYYVVFTGIYGSKTDADGAVATARQAGFGGAYTRQVAS